MCSRRPSLAAIVLTVCSLAGCGGVVPESGENVQVSGKVPAPAGKSVNGFNIQFQTTGGRGQQVMFPLAADGSFSGQMVAGKYTYYLVPGKGAATERALESFPETYRQGSLDRQVEVAAGTVELKF